MSLLVWLDCVHISAKCLYLRKGYELYAATALLIANRIETKSHDGVRQMLGKEFVMTGKIPLKYGRFYSVAFSKRSAGDYEDFITHTKETVMELYPNAEEFVKCIKELL